jgi:putative phosphoribosyl transferase
MTVFRDRDQAGRRLAEALSMFRNRDVVVLGLPRGGVPVAAAVARALHAPLDVIVVRKVGAPGAPELAMGAVGEHGVRVVNETVLTDWNVSEADLDRACSREQAEVDLRVRRFRGGRPPVALAGRTAIVVDDGVATGATAKAACLVVRALGPQRVVLALPVASPRALTDLEQVADEVVCLESPDWFAAVGEAYEDFGQVDDDEVVDLLEEARRGSQAAPARAADDRVSDEGGGQGAVRRRRRSRLRRG